MRDVIASKLREVREKVARAAERVGRDPSEIRLIGAAKTMPAEVVRAAVEAGLSDIGQNYVQEAIAVKSELESTETGAALCWHCIGHLQRNKAARAAETFDVVQTVDRLSLGSALARHAAERGVALSVLVEVNLAAEPTKSGAKPTEVAGLVEALRREPALRVDGLMAIPPAADEGEARRHFQKLRELRDENELRELSMGMTNDFEVAVEEGATMVRVGRAIFGERNR